VPATSGTVCASIQDAANAPKEPLDSVLPTVEAADVNSQVATRERETRTSVLPMVVESDANLKAAASRQLVVPIFVPPMEVVVDVRLLVATSLLSRPPSFVSSMAEERNASLLVAKRLPVAVPNSVRLTVVVSDASWRVVLAWRLENRNFAEPTVVAITLEAKKAVALIAHFHPWEAQWAERCNLKHFEVNLARRLQNTAECACESLEQGQDSHYTKDYCIMIVLKEKLCNTIQMCIYYYNKLKLHKKS